MSITQEQHLREARSHVAATIEHLSEHDGAMLCPVADWLVMLREMLIEMRQFDGGES